MTERKTGLDRLAEETQLEIDKQVVDPDYQLVTFQLVKDPPDPLCRIKKPEDSDVQKTK